MVMQTETMQTDNITLMAIMQMDTMPMDTMPMDIMPTDNMPMDNIMLTDITQMGIQTAKRMNCHLLHRLIYAINMARTGMESISVTYTTARTLNNSCYLSNLLLIVTPL